jgi:hypothetical protein
LNELPFSVDTSVMASGKAFIAYPASAREVREAVLATIAKVKNIQPSLKLQPWESNDTPGRCLVDPILQNISDADFVVADISRLNFNVVYEVGFSIGKQKRVFLLRNRAIKRDERLVRETGIFDTMGYYDYSNSDELAKYLVELTDITPLPLKQTRPNRQAPVYLVAPREKTEAEIRLFSRVKKEARLFYRSFDPQEHGRMSVRDAIDNVSESLGIILPLISSNRHDSEIHNLRCSFIAGLSHALDRETLILQAGDEPIPLDYRDAVSIYSAPETIDRYIAKFAPQITEQLQAADRQEYAELQTPINKLFIGASAAENEFLELFLYYIYTDEFESLLRGEAQVVAGRKGSGKSALFFEARDRIRSDIRNVVLDLNPEGFQLRKLKTVVLGQLERGTREHTITAFWEYLLLLELCQKLLEKDRVRHLHDHTLRERYQVLEEAYRNDPFITEGDFAERLLRLTDAIEERFGSVSGRVAEGEVLSRKSVTEFLYKHDLAKLRESVVDYLGRKREVWVLFDNIDKGWTAHGVDDSDLMNVKCLLDAFTKLRNDLDRQNIVFHGVVFIRNDIYELLVKSMPDRGKIAKVTIDWTDSDLLRELLRRRFVSKLPFHKRDIDFDAIWRSVAATHILDGKESSEYIIQRCLMRPRALIDLLRHCRGHAINLGHDKIEEVDFVQGETAYSTDLVSQISLELEDVFPGGEDTLLVFIEAPRLLDEAQLHERIARTKLPEDKREDLIRLLLWYGVIGILRKTGEETYIYNVNYEMKKLSALISARPSKDLVYVVNPAFWRGLDIELT